MFHVEQKGNLKVAFSYAKKKKIDKESLKKELRLALVATS